MSIYEERLAQLTEHLKLHGYRGVMIHDPANIFYYTGFNSDPHERFMALFIDVVKNERAFFVPALDKDAAEEASLIRPIVPISDEQLPFDVVKETLPRLSGKFGIEYRAVNVERFHLLTETYPQLELTNIQPFINEARMQKSPEEIEALKEALRIIEKVLEDGIQKVRIGMTESELVGELEQLMRVHGADGPSFSTIVLSGPKSALPHGSPGDRAFQKGDYLLIDFGVMKNGYCSDITRTFIIGEASERQREIYETVQRSNEAGMKAVEARARYQTFDDAARNVIEEAGYGEYFNNRVGHGIGIELHEEPSVHANNEDRAKVGNVFTIEPGIYIPGEGGVRIEDTVAVGEDGHVEVLSSFPRDLQIIGN